MSPEINRVLIIAAHPDDEVLGCGGLLSRLKLSGSAVMVVVLGEGSSCRYVQPYAEKLQEDIEARRNGFLAAMNLFSITNFQLHDLPCGRFDTVPIIEINKMIERMILEFKPSIVFTHYEYDVNNDHRIVNRAVKMATRPATDGSVQSVLEFEVLSSSECAFDGKPFIPNFFYKLTRKDVDLKSQALECYESEVSDFPFPRSSRGIEVQAMYRGMQCGSVFAEAFRIARCVN